MSAVQQSFAYREVCVNARTNKIEQFRQGDVLLVRVHGKARGTKVPLEMGRVILAHGEATGHHHSLVAETATLRRTEEGVTFLTIEQLTALEHQEHAPIPLELGTYEVVRQREWTDENEPRPVLD